MNVKRFFKVLGACLLAHIAIQLFGYDINWWQSFLISCLFAIAYYDYKGAVK